MCAEGLADLSANKQVNMLLTVHRDAQPVENDRRLLETSIGHGFMHVKRLLLGMLRKLAKRQHGQTPKEGIDSAMHQARLTIATVIAVLPLIASAQSGANQAQQQCAGFSGSDYIKCLSDSMDRQGGRSPAGSSAAAPPQVLARTLATYLNAGWKIESFSYGQRFKAERQKELFENRGGAFVGGAIALASVPNGADYRYLLSRNTKWVMCVIPEEDGEWREGRCTPLN